MNTQFPEVLTPAAALEKRRQLIRDGFCVVPGVLHGEMLEKVQKFTDQFLDEHPVDPRYRYQGSDFHIAAERVWTRNPDQSKHHHPTVDELLDLPEAVAACAALGLEGMSSHGSIIILNKPAHGEEIQQADDSHPAFAEHPDEVDICVGAGDLVVADARVLHAAWPNQTDQRRPLVLLWWSVFPFPRVPSWWEGAIPAEIQTDPDAAYEPTRIPGEYLRER